MRRRASWILSAALAAGLPGAGTLLARQTPSGARPVAGAATTAAAEPPEVTVGDYFGELERLGLLDRSSGTREALAAEVERAEASLEAGDPIGAAVLLYAIVESPRFTDFSDFPEYQNAEYDLAVALFASGAYETSLVYLERVLARGPSALYFAPAHRRAVDVALATRRFAEVLRRVESVKTNEPIPAEASGERAYLRARVAYDAGRLDEAEGELVKISRKSRLFTSALYLRGVIRARRGELRGASDAFCEIVQTPDDDKYTFYVDDRYFTIKDLARLGLGRLAHEEDRHDDAYYHYFQIPDDSDRLPEALFEAAWSMYQKRELATARDLTAEFLRDFPDSPLAPEAMLLAGYIELADCKFEEAEKKLDLVLADLGPLVQTADAIRKSPERRRALFERALEREVARRKDPQAAAARARAQKPEDRILAMLRVDPRFVRLHEAAHGLRREAADAPHVVDAWRALAARFASARVGAVTTDATAEEEAARAAAELVRDVRRLRDEVRRERRQVESAAREKRLDGRAAALRLAELAKAEQELDELEARAARASQAADRALVAKVDPRLRAMIEADLERARRLAGMAHEVADRIEATAEKLARQALDGVWTDLRRVVDKAKLGKVDSVIGQKRKLEIEVEDMAQGRFPPELHGKLYEEGLIGDDEEYWPPEGEFWADEYEGWR